VFENIDFHIVLPMEIPESARFQPKK